MTPPKVHAVPGGSSALRPPPDANQPAAAAPASTTRTIRAADVAAPTDHTPTAAGPAAVDELPPPPMAPRRHTREQLNTKIRVDLRARTNAFVERHQSTLQGVLEAALDEYMTRRGWSWDDYHRSARRG